jgi:CRISPR-associated protein Cas1
MKKFDVQIDKYGVSLAVKDGQFYIKSKDHRQSVPANKIRQITMTKSTSITGAAVQLALDNEIDISFVHKDQMPYARIWNSKFGSISTIRRNQLSFSESIDGSLWIKDVIKEKIKNQMTLIFKISKNVDSPSVQNFRDKMASYLYKIDQSQNSDALILALQ